MSIFITYYCPLRQYPANALVHRPRLLTYVMSEKIKVCYCTKFVT